MFVLENIKIDFDNYFCGLYLFFDYLLFCLLFCNDCFADDNILTFQRTQNSI
jgi:hypothetical protein